MDSRDSYFDTSSRSWGHAAPHWHRYLFATQFAGNGTVLVIGCETGYGAAELAKKARSVVAMDSRKELLDVARKKYSESNIEYVCGVFPDYTF